jgi:hypothetical protein
MDGPLAHGLLGAFIAQRVQVEAVEEGFSGA